MPRILLVQPPVADFYLTRKRTFPYGLAMIAGNLREQGFEVKILDALATSKSRIIERPEGFDYLEDYYGRKDLSAFALFHEFRRFGYSFEHIGKTAKDFDPFLVGISSLFTPYWDMALKTTEIIKANVPECRIVMGGHHPTQMPESVLASGAVDYIIRGEGEHTLPALAHALLKNENIESVPGIGFKKEDGSLHITMPSWCNNLEDAPLPAVDLTDEKFYERNKKRSVMIVSSRGCPMTCSYCAVSAAMDSPPYRRRNVRDVMGELSVVTETSDIGFIDFEDENLCLSKTWFLSLMEEIRTLFGDKTVELRAMNGLYPPSLDRDIITSMAESGFKTLNLSLGSTHPLQLERFNRKDVRQAFERAIQLAVEHDLATVSYIIAGAPGQDPFDSVEDLVYLAQVPTLAGLSIYYPAPGSKDFDTCRNKNVLPADVRQMRSSALPISDTTSRDQSITLLRLSRILNFMKSLGKGRIKLPEPQTCRTGRIPPGAGRSEISLQLLRWFLSDARIRGIDAYGQIYQHKCDPELTRTFLDAILEKGVIG